MTTEAELPRNVTRLQNTAAAGGLFGAAAAASCCMLPLLLFTLGASGPWIGMLVRLTPYQPYFIAFAVACLGSGYWLMRRSANQECDTACSTRLANKYVNSAIVVATILVAAAIAFNFLAPQLN